MIISGAAGAVYIASSASSGTLRGTILVEVEMKFFRRQLIPGITLDHLLF